MPRVRGKGLPLPFYRRTHPAEYATARRPPNGSVMQRVAPAADRERRPREGTIGNLPLPLPGVTVSRMGGSPSSAAPWDGLVPLPPRFAPRRRHAGRGRWRWGQSTPNDAGLYSTREGAPRLSQPGSREPKKGPSEPNHTKRVFIRFS